MWSVFFRQLYIDLHWREFTFKHAVQSLFYRNKFDDELKY